MAYKREDVNGTSPLDMKKLNDNIRNLWGKVFGDINFSDLDNRVQAKLYTNWITPNGDGNLDTQHPYVVKFYIPPDTKKIISAKLSVETSSYRMDSIVTDGGGGVTNAPVLLSVEGGNANLSVSEDSPSTLVTRWGNYEPDSNGHPVHGGDTVTTPATYNLAMHVVGNPFGGLVVDGDYNYPFFTDSYNTIKFAPVYYLRDNATGSTFYGVDLGAINHKHTIKHNHPIFQTAHSHTGSARVTIPNHPHNLKAGIFEGGELPNNVRIKVNGVDLGIVLNGLTAKNDIDISTNLMIGQINRVEVSCGLSATGKLGTARASIFGVVELLQRFKGK